MRFTGDIELGQKKGQQQTLAVKISKYFPEDSEQVFCYFVAKRDNRIQTDSYKILCKKVFNDSALKERQNKNKTRGERIPTKFCAT